MGKEKYFQQIVWTTGNPHAKYEFGPLTSHHTQILKVLNEISKTIKLLEDSAANLCDLVRQLFLRHDTKNTSHQREDW